MFTYLILLSDTVKAAIISAFIALLIIIIRDFVFKLWDKKKEKKQNELKIFREYADPLLDATMGLLWRLN